jgi:D-3-phosphoglycerate dehydrogenase
MLKVLIAEPTHQILKDKLAEAGCICTDHINADSSKLKELIGHYDGLVIRSKYIIDKAFIDHAKDLKFIARAGSGMENIDTDYAELKGIKCFSSPEGNRDAVGEHTLAMLLSLFHKINISDKEVKSGTWDRKANTGIELKGRTVGILGYGNMGSAFAKRLKGFDCKVIAYDKYKSAYSDDYVEEKSEPEFFENTEILSIHVPLTEETEFMINEDYLRKFNRNIFLINTARGNILNTSDLVNNLKKGKVLGACLDVLEYEQASFENILTDKSSKDLDYLIRSDKVILSPHVAGSSDRSFEKIASVLADKIIDHFSNTT